MTQFPVLSLLGCILLKSPISLADDSYSSGEFEIADTVQADQPTTVTLEDTTTDSYDAYGAVGFRIYLATTPPGWGTGPACWLVNYTAAGVSQIQVTIPASVAPAGTVLELSYSAASDEYGSFESFSYSNDFTLEGASGYWSALELNGYGLNNPDDTPCTALQCSRDCNDKYFPDGTVNDMADEPESTYQSWSECFNSCPGTTLEAWNDSNGDDGGDTGDDWTTSSVLSQAATQTTVKASKTATSTATFSSAGTSASDASASTTGTSASATPTASVSTPPASTATGINSASHGPTLTISMVFTWSCLGLLFM